MRRWLFLHEGTCPAHLSMSRDLDLLERVRAGEIEGALRIYQWAEPAVTIGYHQKSFKLHDASLTLPVLRRPTGGGAVLHVHDITFSMCSPVDRGLPGNIQECTRIVSGVFGQALRQCGIDTEHSTGPHAFSEVCFARPSPAELLLRGSKILGLALARRGGFMLVQGVMPLRRNPELTRAVFGPAAVQGTCSIHDVCPGFCLEGFLSRLREGLSSHLGVLLEERGHGHGEYRGADKCEVESRGHDL